MAPGGCATPEGEGWLRRCVADEPRLSEVAAFYGELGFEVRLVPVLEACAEGGCTECFSGDADPARFKVVFTRPTHSSGGEET